MKECTGSRRGLSVARVIAAGVLAAASVTLSAEVSLAATAPSVANAFGNAWTGDSGADRMIERAFRDVLQRSPDDDEFRRYRRRIDRDGWDEHDIRDDLRRREDYRHSRSRASDYPGHSWDVDRIVRRAYEDVLGRTPDEAGLRVYRTHMLDDGWTEHQVRDALRNSQEARSQSAASADRVIRRAYQDILRRDPDAAGLNQYRTEMLDHGWDEQDVREALMRSPEYRRTKAAISDAEASEIVRRAYRTTLGRDPDAGAAGYKARVINDHWTQADVERELRKSAEFRNKR